VLPAAVAEGPEAPFTMIRRWQKALASMVKKHSSGTRMAQ
jgi:hypothetical protein